MNNRCVKNQMLSFFPLFFFSFLFPNYIWTIVVAFKLSKCILYQLNYSNLLCLDLLQGGAIRQELYYLLKDEKDVHFTFGSVRGNGINGASKGMASSKYCLNIAGDTPSSNRLFDAIVSHCVPVIISDEIELPFEDVLDYSEFCIFVRASDSVKSGLLLNLLRGIEREKWIKMWERLKEIAHHFEYQYPSLEGDAVDMIWGAVSRKKSSIRNKLHRENRYRISQILLKKELR